MTPANVLRKRVLIVDTMYFEFSFIFLKGTYLAGAYSNNISGVFHVIATVIPIRCNAATLFDDRGAQGPPNIGLMREAEELL